LVYRRETCPPWKGVTWGSLWMGRFHSKLFSIMSNFYVVFLYLSCFNMGLPVTYSFSFYHALQKKFTGSIKERLCISFRYSSWFFSVVDIFPPCHLTFHDHILITLVEIFMIFLVPFGFIFSWMFSFWVNHLKI
jgi:hypothetical protein